MPSLQLQQYNALPAHYIRPSDIILSRLCYPGYVLKIPLINVLIGPPKAGRGVSPRLVMEETETHK